MKRIIPFLLAAILLLSLAACGTKDAWQEQYDLGLRYLSDGDYQEAVIAFLAAIEIDAKRPEAYLGAAEAYVALGEPEKAEDILHRGYEETEDENVKEALDDITAPLIATDADFELFTDMLTKNEFLWWNASHEESVLPADGTFFDSQTSSAAAAIESYITGSPGFTPSLTLYGYFYGDSAWHSLPEDPQNRFPYGTIVLDADKVDWLLKNVLNIDTDPRSETSDTFYYDGASVYISSPSGLGSGSECGYTILNINELDNGEYEVLVREDWYDTFPHGTPFRSVNYQFTVALHKDAEHGTYWSIKKITLPDAAASTTVSLTDFKGSYENTHWTSMAEKYAIKIDENGNWRWSMPRDTVQGTAHVENGKLILTAGAAEAYSVVDGTWTQYTSKRTAVAVLSKNGTLTLTWTDDDGTTTWQEVMQRTGG